MTFRAGEVLPRQQLFTGGELFTRLRQAGLPPEGQQLVALQAGHGKDRLVSLPFHRDPEQQLPVPVGNEKQVFLVPRSIQVSRLPRCAGRVSGFRPAAERAGVRPVAFRRGELVHHLGKKHLPVKHGQLTKNRIFPGGSTLTAVKSRGNNPLRLPVAGLSHGSPEAFVLRRAAEQGFPVPAGIEDFPAHFLPGDRFNDIFILRPRRRL